MAEGNNVEVKFGADVAELKSGMAAATASVKESTDQMKANFTRLNSDVTTSIKGVSDSVKSGFAQIQGAMSQVSGAFMAIGAVLAGGAAFKNVVEETVKWSFEALNLSKTLGVTTEAASVLNLALGDIYVSSDTFTGAASMMTRNLRTNEQAFKDLGVKTRDQYGHYRNTVDIMTDVNDRLRAIKEGTYRNVVGMSVYGQGWREASNLMRLTSEKMREAKEKAEALGLTVGQDSVDQMMAYKAAMNDVGDVFTALKIQIGNALLPVLTQLGAWFNSIGPTAVLAFKVAVAEVMTIIYGLGFAFTFVKEMAQAVILQVITLLGTLGQVAWKVLKGDFKGAWQAAKDGGEDFNKAAQMAFDNIGTAAQKTQEKLKKLWMETMGLSAPKKARAETPTGGAYDGAPKEDKSRVADWKSELEAKKDDEAYYFKSSLNMELAFWQEKLALAKGNAKEETAIGHEIYALHKTQAQQGLAGDIADLKYQQEIARKGGDEKLAIEEQIVQRVKAAYGEDSKEYKAALREKEKMHRQYNEEQIRLIEARIDQEKQLSLISVGMDEENIKFRKEMGRISAVEEVNLTKEVEQKKYAIERDTLESKLALQQEDLAAQEKTLGEIEALEKNHGLKLQQLSNQKTLAIKSDWDNVFSAVTSAFETSIQGMIVGTTTLKKAVQNLAQSILAEFVNLGVKQVFAMISTQLALTNATAAGAASRIAIESWAAIKSAAIWVGTALKDIAVKAYEAAAGAYAAVVGIPVVGPILAPIAAGTAFAAVSGFGASVASAAGGWEVPADQMAMVHKNEMVLPAGLSDRIRNMTEPSQQPNTSVNVTVQAMDSRDVKRFFNRHGGNIADALKGEYRNYKR